MKFSLDELVRMTKIAPALEDADELNLRLMLVSDDDDPVLCQAIRNELTRRRLLRRSLFGGKG